MSLLYELEPPTHGKVLLKTTIGDIEIALWSKEAPKTCRNFVQHCVNNYYNGTIFHKIQKDFMIQGGDPTGTGQGGESIYGHAFNDEFHQRLRFSRRGLVAMANCGRPNSNYSQFFITLGPCNDLNNKNTIFGHIVGNTMYNVLKMLDIEVDFSGRPMDPPKIIKAIIVEIPFPDIISTIKENNVENDIAAKKESIFKHVKASKNRQLLSFGDDVDEDFNEDSIVSITKKPKSIHDVIMDDPTISNNTLVQDQKLPAEEQCLNEVRKRKIEDESPQNIISHQSKTNSDYNKQIESDDDDDGATKKEKTQKKLQKIKEEQRKIKKEMKKNMLSVIKKKKQVEKLKNEMNNDAMNGNNNEDDALYGYDVDSYGSFDVGTIDDYLKLNLKYMVKSQKSKLAFKNKKADREEMVLSLLNDFSKKLQENTTMDDKADIKNLMSDQSWMNHKLEFEKDYSVSNAIDVHVVSIENYDITDPRNQLNQHKMPKKKDE